MFRWIFTSQVFKSENSDSHTTFWHASIGKLNTPDLIIIPGSQDFQLFQMVRWHQLDPVIKQSRRIFGTENWNERVSGRWRSHASEKLCVIRHTSLLNTFACRLFLRNFIFYLNLYTKNYLIAITTWGTSITAVTSWTLENRICIIVNILQVILIFK